MRSAISILFFVTAAGCQPAPSSGELDQAEEEQHNVKSQLKANAKAQAPVIDHGGYVIPASKVYAIYWGPAAGFPSDLASGMASLLGGFNGSSYLGIAGQYMRGAAISTAYMGATSDSSNPPSNAPTAAALGTEVCKLFVSPDPNALYVVFTSNAPNINYCAWHSTATCNGVTFQVAYMPNQALLPNCSPYTRSNLGCNTYSDGTVTTADSLAHEFMETITDAHINAWYDKSKAEVGDKCNFVYQACVDLPTGPWQIQSIWSNAISGCQQD
jgi:hypothetical protein